MPSPANEFVLFAFVRRQKPSTAEELLKRPELNCHDLIRFGIELPKEEFEVLEAVEIEIKYSGYIKRQLELIAQSERLENMPLPADLLYERIRGLSTEEVEKLKKQLADFHISKKR